MKQYKQDIVVIAGNEYLVSTDEGPDSGRYSTTIRSGCNNTGRERLYYKAHASDTDAAAAHRTLVEDINRGRFRIVNGRFTRVP